MFALGCPVRKGIVWLVRLFKTSLASVAFNSSRPSPVYAETIQHFSPSSAKVFFCCKYRRIVLNNIILIYGNIKCFTFKTPGQTPSAHILIFHIVEECLLLIFQYPSSINKIDCVLSRCFKKSCPKPRPLQAPSIRPGISAMTKELSNPREESTTPNCGVSVVKG